MTESERLAIEAARAVAQEVGAIITDNREWMRANPALAFAFHDAMWKGLRVERVPFWRLRSAFHKMKARRARALATAAGWKVLCAEVATLNDRRVTAWNREQRFAA